MSNRLFIILTILDNALVTAASLLKVSDPNDQGLDDELAAFLQTTRERIQAYLIRSQTPPTA